MSSQFKRSQTVSLLSSKKESPLIPIKVLEKYSPPVTEFESVREFQQYLTEHKDEMDAMTTHMLNKTFRVLDRDATDPDAPLKQYTITKLKGVISLKLSRTQAATPSSDLHHQRDMVAQFEESLAVLEEKLAAIVTILEKNGLLHVDE